VQIVEQNQGVTIRNHRDGRKNIAHRK